MSNEVPLKLGEKTFRVSDSIGTFCPNVNCPHRMALEREQYTSLQLTAVNHILEEKQRYFIMKHERLEAEIQMKGDQLRQLHEVVTREKTRREEVEKQLSEIRNLLQTKSTAADSAVIIQTAEVEHIQQEKKLLIEQVIQLQRALNDMVRLNETLQFALRHCDVNMETEMSVNVPSLKESFVSKPHIHSNTPSSSPSPSPSSSSPSSSSLLLSMVAVPSNSPLLSDAIISAKVNEISHMSKETRESNSNSCSMFNIENNPINIPTLLQYDGQGEDNNQTIVQPIRGVISELETLRQFLDTLDTKSS